MDAVCLQEIEWTAFEYWTFEPFNWLYGLKHLDTTAQGLCY